MRVAALDLGSNSFLLLIADVENGKVINVLSDNLRTTRLGQGVHKNRMFHHEALSRAEECFKEYAEIISQFKIDKTVAVATSAARDVGNFSSLHALGEKYGINIQVISGEKEAEITYKGATYDFASRKGVAVVDVGGGSTEVILQNAIGKLIATSVNVGSVRLTELFYPNHPVADTDIKSAQEMLNTEIKKAFDLCQVWPKQQNPRVEKLVAVAGTPTTMAALAQGKPYAEASVHGYSLELKELEKWLLKLGQMSVPERQKLAGLDAKRSDVIVAGLQILITVAKSLGVYAIEVSDRGVRYGVAIAAEDGSLS